MRDALYVDDVPVAFAISSKSTPDSDPECCEGDEDEGCREEGQLEGLVERVSEPPWGRRLVWGVILSLAHFFFSLRANLL